MKVKFKNLEFDVKEVLSRQEQSIVRGGYEGGGSGTSGGGCPAGQQPCTMSTNVNGNFINLTGCCSFGNPPPLSGGVLNPPSPCPHGVYPC